MRIPAVARYLTLSGRNWDDAGAVLTVDVQPARVLDLIRIGDGVHAATTIAPAEDAQLRLEARRPPAEIAIGAYPQSYPTDRWRRALPACLNPRAPATRETFLRDPQAFAQACDDEPLATNLAEIAADCLAGPLSDASLQAAAALLRRLANHPMDRSPGLGALVAALCQKGNAP